MNTGKARRQNGRLCVLHYRGRTGLGMSGLGSHECVSRRERERWVPEGVGRVGTSLGHSVPERENEKVTQTYEKGTACCAAQFRHKRAR